MTKQVLIALLITGLSAIAKAEPTVYFCNTVKLAQVTQSEISKVKSYPFRLFIDTVEKRVKGVGEIISLDATDDVLGTNVNFWRARWNYGQNAFFGSTFDTTFDFRNGVFAYTKISTIGDEDEFITTSFIARCDEF